MVAADGEAVAVGDGAGEEVAVAGEVAGVERGAEAGDVLGVGEAPTGMTAGLLSPRQTRWH